MYIFVSFKTQHIQCHVSNNFEYIVNNVDKWKVGKDGKVYPFGIFINTYKLKDTMVKKKESLFVLLYSEDKGKHYDVYAVSVDYDTLSRLAKHRKGSAGLDGKNHYHRIIRTTYNYYDPLIDGDQAIDLKYLEEVVQMEKDLSSDEKKKFTMMRQSNGIILFDENGEFYCTCDSMTEVNEELAEAGASL